MENSVAMKPFRLSNRNMERKMNGVDGDVCDCWENVCNIDVTELECALELAAWQRQAVDKQRPTPSH